MDITLFDLRRLLAPTVMVEPAEVELEKKWSVFEKELCKFKAEYTKERAALYKLFAQIAKHRDEVGILNAMMGNIESTRLKDSLRTMIEDYENSISIGEIENEAAEIAGRCKAMRKILHDTGAERYNKFTCFICMENLVDTFIDPCGHVICEQCWVKTLNKTTCPGCRTRIESIKRIYSMS